MDVTELFGAEMLIYIELTLDMATMRKLSGLSNFQTNKVFSFKVQFWGS